MSKAFAGGWIHGRTVVDGKVRFLSVSSLQLAESCMRRWWFRYVFDIKEDDTKHTDRGKELHNQVAHYLETGERHRLSSQVLAGMWMIEEPGSDLLVEHDVLLRPDIQRDFTRANSELLLAEAPLRAHGIAVTGAIDLMHGRRTNKGTNDITETLDPEGTIEVMDWKFPGSTKNAKSAAELIHTIQMSGYGKYVFNVAPETRYVRLSHGYMPVKGTPRKVSALVTRDQVEESWESTERLAGSIAETAKESDQENIPYNLNACRAYGRDCPARKHCTAGQHGSLASIFGRTAAQELLGDNVSTAPIATTSLLARLQQKTAQPDPAQVAAEMAKLAANEAETKYPGLTVTISKIEALGIGFVTTAGEAAKAVSAIKLEKLEGTTRPGTGFLSQATVEDPTQFDTILLEATEIAKGQQPDPEPVKNAMPATLPPDAPVSNPVQASAVVETAKPMTSDADVIANVAAAADAPKKRGRPKKEKPVETVPSSGVGSTEAAPAPVASVEAVVPALSEVDNREAHSLAGSTINLFVDCFVEGLEYKPLWPIIDKLMDQLAERAGCVVVGEGGRKIVTDVRLADPNGPLGFGRWKGAVKAYLRETPMEGGNYLFDGSYGEIGAVVVEAMRDIVRKTGGVFVRGAR